jgi:lipopolysaccharide export system protein LptA
MPVSIPRLRRWFVLAAVAVSLVVAGVYLHRRRQVREVLKHIPGKMNVDIQQTAEGFKVSKSEGGRTLFTIQASKVVQFKLGGRAELRNVTITLYGRDSSRYDQIYGDDFAYDPKSGDVTAKGEVRIDLEANPEGLLKPDQSVPTALKNPIHLVTRDLMFNQKTGNAFTNAKVELRMPQASGSAMGVRYTADDNVLTLESQVDLALAGSDQTKLTATRGVISKTPRQVVLESARISHGLQQILAQRATLYLRDDNTVDHVFASDGVEADLPGDSPLHARAAQAEFKVNEAQDGLSVAVLTGNVQVESAGERPSRASAGRVVVDFAARNLVKKIRAEDNVKMIELPARVQGKLATNAQRVEISASAINFVLAKGKRLDHAETSGAAQIAILPAAAEGSHTIVTAGKFEAKFDERSRLTSLHGAPDARIVSSAPGQPDRSSTSQILDVIFRPAAGIDSIVQQGNVAYTDGERQAQANRARYTPADQILELTGSPRITDKGLTTTARVVRMNRASGDATAEGEVKSTYSDLREQPSGALLASSSPIHITSRSMTVHRTAAVATYSGDARIWQDANVVQAPSLQFDRDHRSVVAQGDGQPVSTVLVQVDKKGATTPVSITSGRLTYTDDQHRAHFEGGVIVRGADATITADHLDAFMIPRSQASANQSFKGQGQLDRIVAEGNVSIQGPARRAQGEKLDYTVAEDKFVLTGGSPSIFDAEHGKITGDSLTFYKRDDRVLVEGKDTSPTVTQTRVAR